jgi:hypothetical protein
MAYNMGPWHQTIELNRINKVTVRPKLRHDCKHQTCASSEGATLTDWYIQLIDVGPPLEAIETAKIGLKCCLSKNWPRYTITACYLDADIFQSGYIMNTVCINHENYIVRDEFGVQYRRIEMNLRSKNWHNCLNNWTLFSFYVSTFATLLSLSSISHL